MVGVVGELGQLAAGLQRVGAHQGGRPDLLEGVGVAVEGQLAQGPGQRRPRRPEEREHRPGDLRPPLEVQDAELGADLPVGDPLVGAVAVVVEALDAQHDVVGLRRAVGGVGGRQVGDAQQQVAQGGGDLGRLGLLGGQLRADVTATSGKGPQPSRRRPARRARPTRLDRALTSRRRRSMSAWTPRTRTSSAGGPVDVGPVDPFAGQRRLGGVELVAQQAHVDHGHSTAVPSRPPRHRSAAPSWSRSGGTALRVTVGGTVRASAPLGQGGDRPSCVIGSGRHRPSRYRQSVPAIEVERTGRALRRHRRRRRRGLRRRGRAGTGPPRPERRGKDHHGRDPGGLPAARPRAGCGCSAWIPRRIIAALTRRIGVMLQRGGVYPGMTPREAVRLFASYYAERRARPEDCSTGWA